MFTTVKVLQLVKDAKEASEPKKGHAQPRNRLISSKIKEDVENELENISTDSESD